MKNEKVSLDNSPEWMLDVDQDTKKLQFIYQGHLKGDGKKVVAMNLTKDGNFVDYKIGLLYLRIY